MCCTFENLYIKKEICKLIVIGIIISVIVLPILIIDYFNGERLTRSKVGLDED